MEELLLSPHFAKYKLDDTLRAEAYESAPIDVKAAIKSAIALHFKLIEKFSPISEEDEISAFSIKYQKKSSIASIYIVENDFNSPALFIAALMPAIMASSSLALVFKDIPHKHILLCLELLGLEEVYCISQNQVINLLFQSLASLSVNCLYLGFAQSKEIQAMSLASCSSYYEYFYNPDIFSIKNKEIFKNAYPDSKIYEEISGKDEKIKIDIVAQESLDKFILENNEKNSHSYIVVGEGLEFYHEALFEQKIFIKEEKFFTFAE